MLLHIESSTTAVLFQVLKYVGMLYLASSPALVVSLEDFSPG